MPPCVGGLNMSLPAKLTEFQRGISSGVVDGTLDPGGSDQGHFGGGGPVT